MAGKFHILLVALVYLVHHLDCKKIIIEESRQLGESGPRVSTPLSQAELNKDCGVSDLFKKWTGERFPWMASVTAGEGPGWPAKVSCGGALISERYLLTAAKCVIDETTGLKRHPSQIKVLLGNYDISSADGAAPVPFRLSKVIIHPKFNTVNFENDIALLELAEAVDFSVYMAPICLPTQSDVIDGKMATIAGWGAVEIGGKPLTRLKYVDVKVVPNPECKAVFDKINFNITDSKVCAGFFEGGKGACYGDQGGPLMVANADGRAAAVGILSIVQCAQPGFVDVYSRTSFYLDWIKKNAQIK